VTREQRTVFGEVAELYDRTRPGYPDALFEAVLEYSGAREGHRALEIGAGTGKATRAMSERGIEVTALEPSPGMATVLVSSTPATVIEAKFEDWDVERAAYALVYAAQAWHWVDRAHAYDRAANALEPGGAIALFWNVPKEWDGALGDEIDAVYSEHAPALLRASEQWNLDETLTELEESGRFDDVQKRMFPWIQTYTTDEYVAMMDTHSNHRMLEEETRTRLHGAVRDVVSRHGGNVEVEYVASVYLGRRR
jgi:SAM-dependent methyltransferase